MARITPGLDFIGRRFLAPASLVSVAICCSRRSCHIYALSCGLCAIVVFVTANKDLFAVWWTGRAWRISRGLDPVSSEKGGRGDYAIPVPSATVQGSRNAEASSGAKIRTDPNQPNLLTAQASTSDFAEAISSILSSHSQADVIPHKPSTAYSRRHPLRANPRLHRSLVVPFLDRWYSAYNHRLFKPTTSNTSFLRLRTPRRRNSNDPPSPTSSGHISISIPSRPGSPDPQTSSPLDTASLERLLRIVLGREYTQTSSSSTSTLHLQTTAPDADFVNWQLLDGFATLHGVVRQRARLGKLWPLQEVFGDKSDEPLRRIRSLLDPIVKNAIRKVVLKEAGPGVGGDAMDGGFVAYPVGGRESMVQHLAGVLRDSDVVLDLTLYTVLLSNSTRL